MIPTELLELVAVHVPALREPVEEHDQRSTPGVRVMQSDLAEIRVFVRDVKHRGYSLPHQRRCVWRNSDDNSRCAVHVRKPLSALRVRERIDIESAEGVSGA